MYFKRLEMHGFKSFAEPVVIEFHEGVTAIVGPNGSGKSNISDAIRWVLGEQSPKALRGGKMEEVIFAGTASRKSRGMAEVTLVIDNEAGILDIDYSEVAITRRMYRSGESEYLINDHPCRLRDIRELIMDTGIGVDGYSIIGQGRIADIVSNKPESRREIFEEAAGVTLYKSKKAEAERRLTATENNLDRVNDIIGEIEGRIDGLREDSAKAEKYLALRDRYRDLEINIALRNIENMEHRNAGHQTEIDRLSAQITELQRQRSEVEAKAEHGRQRSEALEQERDQAREALLHTVEEINRLTGQSRLQQERLSQIGREQARLEQEQSQLTERLQQEQQEQAALETSGQEILHQYRAVSKDLQEKVQVHAQYAAEAAALAEAADNGRETLYKLYQQVSAKRSEAHSYESILETLKRRQEQLTAEAEQAAESGEEQQQQWNRVREGRQDALAKIDALRDEIARLTDERNRLAGESRDCAAQAARLRLQSGQKVARKKTIEEMEHNYEGYQFAVRHLMRAGLPGMHGVTAELMQVPAGLETAIETALGAQMQHVICDTDQDAKRAIALLKEHRAGRLTFLPVSSVRGSRAQLNARITSHPGYRGLAVDCVTFDAAYRQIFTYLLGRIAVVDQMDTAIALSKINGSGVRFVTLDGEIINASGAITGGRYKNKTANLLERRNEIAALGQEISELDRQVQEAVAAGEKLDARREALRQKLTEQEEVLRDAELAAAALESRMRGMQEAEENRRSEDARLAAEQDANRKEMADAKQEMETLLAQADAAEAQVAQVQRQVEEALERGETKKIQLDQASEAITAARMQANDWESKKENLEQLRTRVERAVADYQSQIEDRRAQLEQLHAEQATLLTGADGAQERVTELQAEKTALEEQIAAVTEARTAVAAETADLSGQQQTQTAALQASQDQKYQLEIRVARNESQLEAQKERLWTEFELSYAQAQAFRREDFALSASVKESRGIREEIRELGEVNVGAIKEYAAVSQRYTFLTEQRRDITTAMEELREIIRDMDTTIKRRFKENFDQVVAHFEVIFRELFGGGYAELRLEREDDPLESGIEIVAQPPGKKLQNINLMSGGEKTMTAIALMFAVLRTKPTPFCILDEVEAALDDTNIDRFAKYLRKFENIQFALVTHQKATMEYADVLYGVTMPEQGISKVLSLRLGDDFDL